MPAGKGELARADGLLGEALSLSRSRHGMEHPWIARDLRGLADLRILQGDLVGAEQQLRSALMLRRGALGAEHRLVAESLGELGSLLTRTGAYGEAELHLEEALAIVERTRGELRRDGDLPLAM